MVSYLWFFFLFITTLIITKVLFDSRKNDKAPVLTVDAKVVDTREVFCERRRMGAFNYPATTIYYAIFEVESGDQIEFHISPSEYSALAKGQLGKLTFQGKRMGSFKRM